MITLWAISSLMVIRQRWVTLCVVAFYYLVRSRMTTYYCGQLSRGYLSIQLKQSKLMRIVSASENFVWPTIYKYRTIRSQTDL